VSTVWRFLLVGLYVLVAACDPGEVRLLSPENSGTGGAPRLSIHAVVDTPYAALAASLGWTAGVPGAEVRVHLMAEPYGETYWHRATADSIGLAKFPNLLAGLYEVVVTRPLTAAETAQAPSGVRLLAGGRRLDGPSTRPLDVTVAPDQRSSLVFGEIALAWPLPWDIPSEVATDVKYFEVFNNSDTTIYLDGKYWGIGWHLNSDYSAWPCAQTAIVRNDPEGIWAQYIFRFPGTGRDYGLEPGQPALIAKAAIDHRAVDPRLWDLSHADFEWGGYRAADNPDVPNLQQIGLGPMPYFWPMEEAPEFLSEPVDLATLPRFLDPHSGTVWLRIPGTVVLDATARTIDWASQSFAAAPACLEDMHRSFERLAGPAGAVSDFYEELSSQRRVLTVLPDGRKVLQDANTSMVDFVKVARTPGWIP